MAPRTIDGVIDWILECPRVSQTQQRLVALLNDLRDLLQPQKFKYTVSMYVSVNVVLDDGRDGIETSLPEKWFSFEATADEYVVRTGSSERLLTEVIATSEKIKSAMAGAIEFLTQR